jgi:heme/copper-type cytochrome/quinol oxidase subunit 2
MLSSTAKGMLVAEIAGALAACRAGSPRADLTRTELRLVASDTSWSASYLPLDVSTGREIHVPLGAVVTLTLESRDYVALFSIPSFGLREFASPGLPAKWEFRPDGAGSYEIRGDELCGLPHGERTRGRLVVESAASYERWMSARMAVQ